MTSGGKIQTSQYESQTVWRDYFEQGCQKYDSHTETVGKQSTQKAPLPEQILPIKSLKEEITTLDDKYDGHTMHTPPGSPEQSNDSPSKLTLHSRTIDPECYTKHDDSTPLNWDNGTQRSKWTSIGMIIVW